jgi:hypothetical protein
LQAGLNEETRSNSSLEDDQAVSGLQLNEEGVPEQDADGFESEDGLLNTV